MYEIKTCYGGEEMSIARQDAWTQDEDLLLAEVVLRHIRESSTQLKAFEEVGVLLSRTAAACGFRWNSFVRKQYKSGIELAKKQRKENKVIAKETEILLCGEDAAISIAPEESLSFGSSLSFGEVMKYLTRLEEVYKLHSKEKEQYTLENEKLGKQIEALAEENRILKEKMESVEEDYHALLSIMERARKLIVLEEDKKIPKVKFQMDKNGNLERVNK
jgi:prespore-specific regulator